jgi:hypothetical protein
MFQRITSVIRCISVEKLSLLIAVSNLVFHVQKEHEERYGLVHHLHREEKNSFHNFCTVNIDAIIQHKPRNCKMF